MFTRLIFLITFVLMVSQACNAVEVARWDFEETSGTTATDNSGQYSFTLGGADSLGVDGRFGSGVDFAGDGGAILDAAASEAFRFTGDFTIALWINPDTALGDHTRIVDICAADGGLADGYRLKTITGANADNLQFMSRQSGSNTNDMHSRDIPVGIWTLLVVRNDLDGDVTLNVLQDGDNVDTAFVAANSEIWPSAGPIEYADGELKLGRMNGANRKYSGRMDDVAFYDEVLTDDQVASMFYSAGGSAYPLASAPNPTDGILLEASWTNLSWRPGDFAVTHDLYFGTDFDDVNDGVEGTFAGNLATTSQVVGFPSFPAPDGLQPGTTYYWRIDEVNDADPNSPWKGDIWSFWVPPRTAYNSIPADSTMYVLKDVTLNWTPGFGAQLHQVYFGDNFDDVNSASGATLSSETSYTPGTLETGKTYYWRVDEFTNGVTQKGDIWSFTTVPDVAVTNPNLMLWWKLDEDQGTTAVDWSGHGNHGTIFGDAQWADGYQGTALTFGDDVYVESVGYDGPTGASPRTCCAWIRSTVTGNHNIMSWGQNVAGQKWRVRTEGDTGVLCVEVNGGYHYGVTPIADGHWHHVAVTFEDDGSPDVLDTLLYVDGQLDGTGASQATVIDTAAGPVRIGESPWHNAPFLDQIDDARVYDKVLTAEEIQQVMLGDTKLAGSPNPAAYATVDIRDISSLSWSRGDTASSHDVYFGADRDGVANATTDSPEFQGNQTTTSLSVTDKVEFGGGDYYWRVDEVQTDGTVIAGTIWKFTVPDYLVVDDIESYNDLPEDDPASNRIYLSWIDGFGTTTNGAVVGNLDVPLTERANVHGGFQAMPYTYDNNLKTSEATLTLAKHDWTAEGVTKLSLWFRGDAANSAERMYIALNGTAVVYNDDPAVTQKASWTEWVIDLSKFGIDLTNVSSITIGIGTKNAPAAGGTGTMYFDDIRLIR